MNELVSIVMPVKNAMPYLNDCLLSIQGQLYKNWELIAINDHSTDNSFDILNQFAKKDSRIQVYNNEGAGIIPALQLAYFHTRGQFITRMDADDLMAPEKLYQMHAQLLEKGPGHIATGLVKYFSEEQLGDGYQKYEAWLNQLTRSGNNFDDLYRECVIPSPCWMLHISDFVKIGGFASHRYPEDYDLVFRMYAKGLNVIPSNTILHHWRDYNERTSRNHENYADNRFLDLKLHYFLKLDYDFTKRLMLWGAGKKGKAIAKYLIKQNIEFAWVCNNPKKIGREIYGIQLQGFNGIGNTAQVQVLVAVAGAQNQEVVVKELEGFKNSDTYLCC